MATTTNAAQDGLILRRAAKRYECDGDGSTAGRHGAGCPITIDPGDQYVECTWETPAFQSGTRHTLPCAVATHGWKGEAHDTTVALAEIERLAIQTLAGFREGSVRSGASALEKIRAAAADALRHHPS